LGLHSQLVAVKYEIRIRDGLDETWTKWFDGRQIDNDADGETVMSGQSPTRGRCTGLLAKIRDLGLSYHCASHWSAAR
jgi:hypothetical protein